MTAIVSVLTKKPSTMLQLLEKILVRFHSNMTIQHITPAQGGTGQLEVILMRKDFGVQHLLMLI